ncbi:MAG: redoxin domain-containing protein [Flavobacteriales bacterium]|nr:redoxin domain-containing protein [Flavobacteriales bacterium]
MKHLYTLLFSLLVSFSISAQTPLTEAVDFTVTDLDGNEHTLSEYLDAGKYVCIDFFAYWCGPCAAHAPYFTEIYNTYGCNGGDVIFMSMEYEGSWDQTHDFEVANAGDNPAPAISGAEGGGLAVHGDYSIVAYPTFILIDPDWNIVEQDIWPMNVEILDGVLQSYGLQQMTCTSMVEDVASVSVTAWPNPASDALQVEAKPGTRLTLIDLLGREVVSTQALHNITVIDLTTVPEGSYLLRANNAAATETRKVIVRH